MHRSFTQKDVHMIGIRKLIWCPTDSINARRRSQNATRRACYRTGVTMAGPQQTRSVGVTIRMVIMPMSMHIEMTTTRPASIVRLLLWEDVPKIHALKDKWWTQVIITSPPCKENSILESPFPSVGLSDQCLSMHPSSTLLSRIFYVIVW